MKGPRARTMLLRALRLRCPRCGSRQVYARPFRMQTTCPTCALPFRREHGYFVGAIYINYALTIAQRSRFSSPSSGGRVFPSEYA